MPVEAWIELLFGFDTKVPSVAAVGCLVDSVVFFNFKLTTGQLPVAI